MANNVRQGMVAGQHIPYKLIGKNGAQKNQQNLHFLVQKMPQITHNFDCKCVYHDSQSFKNFCKRFPDFCPKKHWTFYSFPHFLTPDFAQKTLLVSGKSLNLGKNWYKRSLGCLQ